MFLLLDRVGALDQLKEGFSAYVKKVGESRVADASREKTLIDDLLVLQATVNTMLAQGELSCFLMLGD